MYRILLLAAVFSVSTAETTGDYRIVGGDDVSIEEVPYQVSLRFKNKHHCGASIISRHYILTAAHCTEEAVIYYSVRSGTDLRLLAGTLHRVVRMHTHEAYHKVRMIPVNDIAVVRVLQPFQLDETRQPVRLPRQGDVTQPDGALATVTGWGALKESGNLPMILQRVQLPLVNHELCQKQLYNQLQENQICAGFLEGGKDSCQGDSGGPLVFEGVQIGVVSWGWGCAAPGYPGVYTQVSAYRNWIKSKTGF